MTYSKNNIHENPQLLLKGTKKVVCHILSNPKLQIELFVAEKLAIISKSYVHLLQELPLTYLFFKTPNFVIYQVEVLASAVRSWLKIWFMLP